MVPPVGSSLESNENAVLTFANSACVTFTFTAAYNLSGVSQSSSQLSSILNGELVRGLKAWTYERLKAVTCSRVISAKYFAAPGNVVSGVIRANKSRTRERRNIRCYLNNPAPGQNGGPETVFLKITPVKSGQCLRMLFI